MFVQKKKKTKTADTELDFKKKRKEISTRNPHHREVV